MTTIFGTLTAKDNDSSIVTDFTKARAFYERDGYILYDFGFSDNLIDHVAQATQSMTGEYVRVQDMWRKDGAVKALGAHADVMALLSKFYERRAFPFQTLNFCVGTQQGTHADSVHFSTQPENFMCGVWVALEDIDMENGPLHYFPGSHKRKNATMADIGETENAGPFFKAAAQSYEKKYGIIKKGQAVIWAANVLHGGDPIVDKTRSRLSQVTHYYFEDCMYMTPLNEMAGRRAYIRYPYDFANGKFVWGRKDGKKVYPHARTWLSGHASNWLKRTPSFK